MQLEHRGRDLRHHRPLEGSPHNIRLGGSIDHQQDAPGVHNGADTHGEGLPGHIGFAGKKSLIRLDCTGGEVYQVGNHGIAVRGLYKANMQKMSKA